MIDTANSAIKPDIQSSIENNQSSISDELYLLNWFALVGPHFGVTIPPAVYKQLAATLDV
jgi:hypothetical protein